MTQTLYLNPADKDDASQGAIRLMRCAFPDYHGRKFKLEICDHPINVTSYWDGGSHSYYRFVEIATRRTSDEVPAQSAYDPQIPGAGRVTLPHGITCVKHCICRGKDMGLTLTIRPENVAKLLPPQMETDDDEAVVLEATARFKPSYGGISDFRYHERGRTMGRERWDAAKARLIGRNLLNKAGAITPAGRNACRP